ncbi:MAG TPA: adenylate/guanylate cyclase domain-containing protein [Rhodopila sp.]|nr:adenylate/guanylate cyclase domain-containing protein [Rhodopila sp.]
MITLTSSSDATERVESERWDDGIPGATGLLGAGSVGKKPTMSTLAKRTTPRNRRHRQPGAEPLQFPGNALAARPRRTGQRATENHRRIAGMLEFVAASSIGVPASMPGFGNECHGNATRRHDALRARVSRMLKPSWGTAPAPISVTNMERRPVSVLFCDIVDSVGLSGRCSLEYYGVLMLAYRELCTVAVLNAGGMVVQYSGDGILACFGYQASQQDDPVRAVRAGLDILQAIHALNSCLAAEGGPTFAVRIAVHADIVLTCSFDVGPVQEPMVIGEAPNIAGRLQKLAQPNTLLVSRAVFQAVGHHYEGRPLGPCPIRGLSRTLDVFEILPEAPYG